MFRFSRNCMRSGSAETCRNSLWPPRSTRRGEASIEVPAFAPIRTSVNLSPQAPSDVAVETESQYHCGAEAMSVPTDRSQPVRIPLTQLRRGQRAIVDCSELTDLPEGDRCLLHAMGMHHECEVRVCRPGTPCIVQIDSTRLGISGDVARKILVTPIEDSPGTPAAPESRA